MKSETDSQRSIPPHFLDACCSAGAFGWRLRQILEVVVADASTFLLLGDSLRQATRYISSDTGTSHVCALLRSIADMVCRARVTHVRGQT
jgi:hypothetical protein